MRRRRTREREDGRGDHPGDPEQTTHVHLLLAWTKLFAT
jgi:hypothetical protein